MPAVRRVGGVAVVVRAEGLVAVAIQSPLWDPLRGGPEDAVTVQCTPFCTIPLVHEELADTPGGDGPPHPAQLSSLQ